MIELITVIVLLILGYAFGKHAESKHYESIKHRERLLVRLPAVNTKNRLATLNI